MSIIWDWDKLYIIPKNWPLYINIHYLKVIPLLQFSILQSAKKV